MKLYVGVSREAGRRVVVVARRRAGPIEYKLCWQGAAEDLEELACAILTEHLGGGERALTLGAGFARLMAARRRADFWTLRESEIAEAVAGLG